MNLGVLQPSFNEFWKKWEIKNSDFSIVVHAKLTQYTLHCWKIIPLHKTEKRKARFPGFERVAVDAPGHPHSSCLI